MANLLQAIILFLYSLCTVVVITVYTVVLIATFNFKQVKRVIKKLFVSCHKKNNKQHIWIHASSVGESLSAFFIVQYIMQKYPKYSVLITTCTKTSEELWKKEFGNKITYCTLPWDLKICANIFLRKFSIKLALFIEADFWINFLTTLKAHKVPTLLVNGRMFDRSYKKWLKFPFFIKTALNTFSFLSAQSLESKKNIERLSKNKPVFFFGSLKYTAALVNIPKAELQHLRELTTGKIIFLALSTHSKEELMIADIHSKLQQNIPNLLTIIIPRHPSRIKKVVNDIKKLKVNYYLYSKGLTFLPNKGILVVDKMGVGPLFCKISSLVYIGKSMFLDNKGGHNLLEPMQQQNVGVIFGPYMDTFREIADLAIAKGAAIEVKTPQELYNRLLQILPNKNLLNNISECTQQVLDQEKQVKDKYLQVIDKYLN